MGIADRCRAVEQSGSTTSRAMRLAMVAVILGRLDMRVAVSMRFPAFMAAVVAGMKVAGIRVGDIRARC
jgi:hypothetical protein